MKLLEKIQAIRDIRNSVKLILLCIVLLTGFLIPQKKTFPDSETVCYQAMLYQIVDYDQPSVQEHHLGRLTGREIWILKQKIYDSVDFTPNPLSYTHIRSNETRGNRVCRI
ncbi:MAG: hypothetical protein K2J71_09750, partial [Oscillospiraceae bacterium]|nr:hypothetical protein [Oscillospiraceae bacterium]